MNKAGNAPCSATFQIHAMASASMRISGSQSSERGQQEGTVETGQPEEEIRQFEEAVAGAEIGSEAGGKEGRAAISKPRRQYACRGEGQKEAEIMIVEMPLRRVLHVTARMTEEGPRRDMRGGRTDARVAFAQTVGEQIEDISMPREIAATVMRSVIEAIAITVTVADVFTATVQAPATIASLTAIAEIAM